MDQALAHLAGLAGRLVGDISQFVGDLPAAASLGTRDDSYLLAVRIR